MTDVKILKQELKTVNPSRPLSKGFQPDPRRSIRFKLDNLDFTLKLGEMDNFRIRPLFFSIRDDSYAAVRRWNNRQITYNILKNVRPVHRNLSRQMNNKIGHGDGNTIPGDSTTKLSDEESATDVINRNLNTEGIIYKNIPISRTENGARDEVEQIIYEGQIAPNVSGTFSKIETYRSLWIPVHSELMSRTYRTTEVSGEALLLESIKRSSIHGTVPVGVKQFKPRSSEVDATERIMLRILQTVMTDRDLSETLKKTRLSDKLETDLSKLQEQNERNAILIRSTQQYARITRKHNTIGSGVKEGSLVESPKLQKGNRNSLAEVGDNETTGTKKGRNFLKKLWNRIIKKSNKKTDIEKDVQAVKPSKKSSRLTRLFCFVQSKTLE